VTYLPAFWLLVPGSLSVIGRTRLVDSNGPAGYPQVVAAAGALVAIVLGILCGEPLCNVVSAWVAPLLRSTVPALRARARHGVLLRSARSEPSQRKAMLAPVTRSRAPGGGTGCD
jgi:hypothetical protein